MHPYMTKEEIRPREQTTRFQAAGAKLEEKTAVSHWYNYFYFSNIREIKMQAGRTSFSGRGRNSFLAS